MPTRPFIKAADTKSPVSNSKVELERMLKRYGATSFNVTQDFVTRRASVTFMVPNDPSHPSAQVPVRLYVETLRIARLLHNQPKWTLARFSDAQIEKAERVAWRNLVLWVDAALSAASIGMQTITEAFFAHTVVGLGGERMIDLVEEYQQQLGSGVQRLLTATAETD